jgi:hypothetical protein
MGETREITFTAKSILIRQFLTAAALNTMLVSQSPQLLLVFVSCKND